MTEDASHEVVPTEHLVNIGSTFHFPWKSSDYVNAPFTAQFMLGGVQSIFRNAEHFNVTVSPTSDDGEYDGTQFLANGDLKKSIQIITGDYRKGRAAPDELTAETPPRLKSAPFGLIVFIDPIYTGLEFIKSNPLQISGVPEMQQFLRENSPDPEKATLEDLHFQIDTPNGMFEAPPLFYIFNDEIRDGEITQAIEVVFNTFYPAETGPLTSVPEKNPRLLLPGSINDLNELMGKFVIHKPRPPAYELMNSA